MSDEGIPLQDQYPGDNASLEELPKWAKKARKRIVRDIDEKIKFKYKNKKLKIQLQGQSIHHTKIRAQIADYESMFSSGLWACIKSCWFENWK